MRGLSSRFTSRKVPSPSARPAEASCSCRFAGGDSSGSDPRFRLQLSDTRSEGRSENGAVRSTVVFQKIDRRRCVRARSRADAEYPRRTGLHHVVCRCRRHQQRGLLLYHGGDNGTGILTGKGAKDNRNEVLINKLGYALHDLIRSAPGRRRSRAL